MSEQNQVWVRVCKLTELAPDKAMGFNVNGQRLILARCGDEAYILQGFCSHLLFPLAGAKVEGCVLTCSLHHSKFDVRDGSVNEWSTFPPLVGAALATVRQRKNLQTYSTRITDGDVYILWPAADANDVRIKL